MKKNTLIKIAVCLSVLLIQAAAMMLFLFSGCAVQNNAEEIEEAQGPNELPKISSSEKEKTESLECLYADTAKLDRLIEESKPVSDAKESCAVILPHYANAFSMCCDLLSGIERDIELVVIVGPNHSGEGESVQISGADWYWSSAYVHGEVETAKRLASDCTAALSNRVISKDWSVQSLIPYVHSYFPNARIVTVLLARGTDEGVLKSFAQTLAEISEEQELLLVGSADFSHYLDPETAAKNDEITVSCIENEETSRLLTLDNGYIDSPETAALVIHYADLKEAQMRKCAALFEIYWENGQEKAGSYYTFYALQEP